MQIPLWVPGVFLLCLINIDGHASVLVVLKEELLSGVLNGATADVVHPLYSAGKAPAPAPLPPCNCAGVADALVSTAAHPLSVFFPSSAAIFVE